MNMIKKVSVFLVVIFMSSCGIKTGTYDELIKPYIEKYGAPDSITERCNTYQNFFNIDYLYYHKEAYWFKTEFTATIEFEGKDEYHYKLDRFSYSTK